jgi:hypothetical protein
LEAEFGFGRFEEGVLDDSFTACVCFLFLYFGEAHEGAYGEEGIFLGCAFDFEVDAA